MAVTDERKDLSAQDARQGVETGTVRWVLRISLGLAVLAGIVIYFSFADL
ncbi:MAG TPA: hypothetical protein VGM68_07565 [Rhizomicrobium sp.]|jgi:hypothetical protein